VPDDVLATLQHRPQLRIKRQPVHIQTALAQAQAVLNYGSSTLVAQTVLAGKPQLMLPTDHEKFMVSAQVARNGLGSVCGERESVADVQRFAQDLLVDSRAAQAARTVAARHGNLSEQAAKAIREALCGAAHISTKRQLAKH
jgi:UDP:flavonoid glycosyltransferase YjiC (YdhE family)